MNTPPEVMNMGSPEEYHDPGLPGHHFDLSVQPQTWKDGSQSTTVLQPNGGYDDKLDVKEEEEQETRERGHEEYEKVNEEDEEFSSAPSSGSSGDEADDDEDNEDDQLDRESLTHEQSLRRGSHSDESESEDPESSREQINYGLGEPIGTRNREVDEDVALHEESHTAHDVHDDLEGSRREMNQGDIEEEDDEEDEGEYEDENDEEDRIKETQKLVAKIEHDIQGLRFQAKQRGHLLSDLHRYGAQNQQRRKEQEYMKQSSKEPTSNPHRTAPQPKPSDEGKIIERPVSIKLRLRTRSTSPKTQQEQYALPPVVKAKPGKVIKRVLRIGKQLGRWEAWKESLAAKTDSELAKIMMDHMDKSYFQQFMAPPKPEKGLKRKKKESLKHQRKTKKPKQVKVEKPEEWADGYLDDDDIDDIYDPVEEKDDYDYDPARDSEAFGAYKTSNPVRNKRKSQRPRKLMDVNSSPRQSRMTKSTTRQPKRSLKVQKNREQEGGEAPVVQLKKRGRKPKPKPIIIKTEKKKRRAPRIHTGGRRPSVMSTLKNLDWNALPRRYECKICCLRLDGIDDFRSHLESVHGAEYLKSKEPTNPVGEENSNDGQEAEKHFHGSEKQFHDPGKHYEDLGHLPDQHSSMQENEQRRMAESEMYRTMAYGPDMVDARRFEMMPPFKRHLHESYSNEWGKMQGNMYSRPLASGQMMPGEQSWGPNRGYDAIPGYRKHYEDGREWGKSGGQYPHVITSLGQNMQMGIDGGGGGGHRQEQHGEGYNMPEGNLMGMDSAPSQDNTYVDMNLRHSEENTHPNDEDVTQERTERVEESVNDQRPEKETEHDTESRSNEGIKEVEDGTNEQQDDDDQKEDEDEPGMKKKRKKTKPVKEWEEIDRWANTFVHCPQCDDYIRFRPGQKNFHFAVHAERRLCQECGKMFTKEAFRAHVRVHQAKKLGEVLKHICEVCGKGYRFKCSLSSHMRCHTGEREFECKICGKKFLSTHGLEKHELVHRKVKPHMCPDCGRGFTQYHNMLAHRRQHTGEKPYRCNFCDRSFTHNVSLKNHKKKEHGVDLWAGSGGKPPSSSRQRSKSTKSAPTVPVSPPVPQQPPSQPKPSVPSERELMHTLDPTQLYNMMPTLDYGHY
nr:uncharacterized protein LOC129257735 [Lytechinus pictus]